MNAQQVTFGLLEALFLCLLIQEKERKERRKKKGKKGRMEEEKAGK